jgi:TATA-box binding protein (TBP) (component of TFIID and TFIIIB)
MIISTNAVFNLEWLFDVLKPHVCCNDDTNDSPVITKIRFKNREYPENQVSTCFPNSLSLVAFVQKRITVKIPKHGKIQITGATSEEHGIEFIKLFFNLIRKHDQHDDAYKISGDYFTTFVIVIMMNKVFSVGFRINRQKLDRYVNEHTDLCSFLEPSSGYTGANIKFPFSIDLDATPCIKLEYTTRWETALTTYRSFIDTLPAKWRSKYLYRKCTFLIFYSGKTIITCVKSPQMERYYKQFIEMIHNAKSLIEDRDLV